MRTLTAQETKVLGIGKPATFTSVQVKDTSGTWWDLSNLAGLDWISSVEIDEQIDQPTAQATVELRRESYNLSLAQLVQGSKINNLTGGFSALIAAGRECKVLTATLPLGQTPGGSDWREVFHGYIDEPDFSADPFTFQCRDLGGALQDLWIESDTLADGVTPRTYGSALPGTAMETVIQAIINDAYATQWSSGLTRALRDRIRPVTPNGFWYRCTTAGASGGGEPVWPTTIGATVNDGAAVWTCYATIPQLFVPASPSFNIALYRQKQQSVLDAIRTLAQLAGWDLRYLWDNGTSAFRLTLYQPVRVPGATVYTHDADHYYDVKELKVSRQDIRNKVQVTWVNQNVLDNSGLPTRTKTVVEDATSQDQYTGGLPKFCEIAEAATSQINTSAQASTLANAVLSDLKDPIAEQQIELPYFYAAVLGDYYKFTANGIHYSADQSLAVVTFHHTLNGSQARTTLTTRGKPCGAYSTWLSKEARPGSANPAPFAPPPAPTGATVAPSVNGLVVTFSPPAQLSFPAAQNGQQFLETELHVSTSNGFTPSSSTLYGRTTTNKFTVGGLIPGTTYYGKLISRDSLGNASPASAQFTVQAGYVGAYSMQPQVAYNVLPPNPSFEANNVAGAPPDTWTMASGTWGTDAVLDTSNQFTGTNSVKMPSTGAATAKIASQLVAAEPNVPVRMTVWAKAGSAQVNGLQLEIHFYSDINTDFAQVTQAFNTTTGWSKYILETNTNAITKYVKAVLVKNGVAIDLWFDSVGLEGFPVQASYTTNFGQLIGNNLNAVVNYGTKVYDNANAVTIGASWTFTAPIDGYYLVTAAIDWLTSPAGDYILGAWVNGSETYRLNRNRGDGLGIMGQAGSCVVHLNKGDTVQIKAFQNSGGNLNLESSALNNYVQLALIAW